MKRKGHWVSRDEVLVSHALNVSVREHSLEILKNRFKVIILVKDKTDLQFLVNETLKGLVRVLETQSDEIEAETATLPGESERTSPAMDVVDQAIDRLRKHPSCQYASFTSGSFG